MQQIYNQSLLQQYVKALLSTNSLLALFAIILTYRLLIIIYNAFFHPLAEFPGPLARAISQLPLCRSMWSGYDHEHMKNLHDRYGPVVRTAPSALSFNSPRAWQDIYGFSKDRKQIPKDLHFYMPENIHGTRSLISADDGDHARMRKLLAHAFSAQALREQEDILNTYFNLLISRLQGHIGGSSQGKVDLTQWFNFFTFDAIGDLALGKSFGMLEDSRAPAFMDRIMRGSRYLIVLWTGQIIPLFGVLLKLYAKIPGTTDPRRRMNQFAVKCAEERLSEKRDRKDFMSYILKHNDKRGMTTTEIDKTAAVILNAGSETTATALTSCVWLLLKHPKVLERVTGEVRSKFSVAGEMNLQSTSTANLPYLFAVIEESLRTYNPVGGVGLPRKTTKDTVIDGVVVSAGTRISVHGYASMMCEANWEDPASFIPERWLGDERYASDQRGAFQPFSTGPRVCIGKNLAYAEMMSVMARMLFHFDMTLCDESIGWGHKQKTFVFWEKPPLMVRLALSDGSKGRI